MVPGKKMRPVVFVESIKAIIPDLMLRLTIGAAPPTSLPQGQGCLDPRREVLHVVAQPVQGDGCSRHRVSDHHPPDRHEVSRLGLEDPESHHEAERESPGGRQPNQERHECVRNLCRAATRGECAEHHHYGDQPKCEEGAVLVEDGLNDVADRDELHHGARHRDGYLALESGPLPPRNADGQGDEGQARCDLGQGDVDPGVHGAISTTWSERRSA